MFKSPEWSIYSHTKHPELPETEVPIQYTLPFEQWSLKVSEEAHKEYGFTPLTGSAQKGSVDTLPEDLVCHINIWLLSPQELSDFHDEIAYKIIDTDDAAKLTVAQKANVNEKGVEIAYGLHYDKDSLLNTLGNWYDGEELDDAQLQQEVTQTLFHRWREAVYASAAYSIAEWWRTPVAKGVLKLRRQMYLQGLGSAALGGALAGIPNYLAYQEVNPGEIAVGVGLFGGLGIAAALPDAAWQLKQYIVQTNQRERGIHSKVKERLWVIDEELHTTYCTRHFDYTSQEWLELELPEDDDRNH